MSKAPKLLTTKEVSEILGIKPDTLAVWRCTGRYDIPYVKIGGRVRYKEKDIAKFIERQTHKKVNPSN